MAKPLIMPKDTTRPDAKPKPVLKPKAPPRINDLEDNKRSKFKCISCGKKFGTQQGNFLKVSSYIYDGNDHYEPICIPCLQKMYQYYINELGSEKKAMERICEKIDLYFNEDIWNAITSSASREKYITVYSGRVSLQHKGKAYDDTIKDRERKAIEEADLTGRIEPLTVDPTAVKRWGLGYSPEEYVLAENHYHMLEESNPNLDDGQEVFIKDLCTTKVLQVRAFKDNDPDRYEKYTKLYQTTFKAAKLKVGSDDADVKNDENTTFGAFLDNIETFACGELYKDKKLFADIDEIKDYFTRFIVRPFKNFFTGTNDLDNEFSIDNGEDDDEG